MRWGNISSFKERGIRGEVSENEATSPPKIRKLFFSFLVLCREAIQDSFMELSKVEFDSDGGARIVRER